MTDINISDIRRLDGGLLLVFRELLRRRNATETAKYLHLSQSAVSHALSRLRDLFDDPLFIRRPHGFEPTRRALELGPRIEGLIDLATETLQGDVGFNPSQSERRFSLGAPEFVTALIGAPLARIMQERAPSTSFHVQHLTHEAAQNLLRRGEIDLALGRFGDLRRTGFHVERLYEDRYCVVARKGHPTLRNSIDIQQYSQIGHVFSGSFSEGDPGEEIPDPRLVATTAVVPSWLTALVMVSSSDVISTCPRRLAERMTKVLQIQVLDAPFQHSSFTVSAVRRGPGDDVGIDWLVDQVRHAVR